MVTSNVPSTERNVAHLLRRAAFGGTPEEISRGVSDGIAATVERLLDPASAPPAGDAHRGPGLDAYEPSDFFIWWFRLATTSPAQGIERLAWFWHGHFATALPKVRYPSLLRDQLVTLRRHGLGRFDDLLNLVSHDTAMNLWLDLYTSVVGRPNENFARELMELFSLGVDGGYSQTDVGEAARAFTGYSLVTAEAAPRRPVGTALRPELHDHGAKSVLGRSGALTGADVIEEIVVQPACHRFVAERFWARYAGSVPSDDLIERLAAAFARRLDIGDLLEALLTSEEFYGEGVQHALVAQPVEVLVRTLRNFHLEVPDLGAVRLEDAPQPVRREARQLISWSRLLGQIPGLPPNVGGWPGNEGWLTTDVIAGRLAVGVDIGEALSRAEEPLADELRGLGPPDKAERILREFGLTEWSDSTIAAVETAAAAQSGPSSLAGAFAVAFSSPEVILA